MKYWMQLLELWCGSYNLIIKKVVKIQLNAEEPQFEGEQQIHIQF